MIRTCFCGRFRLTGVAGAVEDDHQRVHTLDMCEERRPHNAEPTWGSEAIFDAMVVELVGRVADPFGLALDSNEARHMAAQVIARLRKLPQDHADGD